MINPYFIYVLSFLAVLITYLFGWSNLFPEIEITLLLFIIISTLIALFTGKAFMKRKIITFNKIEYRKSHVWVTIAILLGYMVEFIYHRNFPLLAILNRTSLSYHEFGIPTFHVLLVTFNSFYSILLFQSIISKTKNRKLSVVLFLLTLIPSILIMNRGMLILILMSCVFVYLIKYQQNITFKKVVSLSIIAVLFLYLFGIVGNVRVNNSYQTDTSLLDNSLFLQIGGATEEFKESIVPKEFFWAYIYIASPLANLQENIGDYEHEGDITVADSLLFGSTQLLPDFISKRVIAYYEAEKPSVLLITPELNVATAFAEPFAILGWVGISVFTIVIFIFAFFYILFLKSLKSEYFVIGVAILNTIFVFNTFSNMFSFSGLSFQLVYPILFSFLKMKSLSFTGNSELETSLD